MAACTRCNQRDAEWRIDGAACCSAPPCMIGALRLSPDAVMPFFDRDAAGAVRPASSDLAPLELANVPAAADTADMLLSLSRMDQRARVDALGAMRTAALRLLGPQQHSEAAFADFSRDCLDQVRTTRALRLRFLHTGRAVDPAFLALTLATLYVAWIGGQRGMVHAHVQTIDALLTLSLGAADAAAVEAQFYAPL